MSSPCKTVHVIAGPNGAGKSTFVENYLNRYVDDKALWGSLNVNGKGRIMIRENNSDGELSADERIAAACRDSGEQVILRAEQTGTSVVIWRDGKIVHLTAAEARAKSLRKKTRND